MPKRNIDAFLFDLDGTLIDSSKDLAISANFTRDHYGKEPLSQDTIIGYVGDGLGLLIQRLFPEFSPSELQEAKSIFQQHYRVHCLDYTRPYPGVLETLEYFSHKIKAVISNKPQSASKQILEALGMAKHFSLILGGDSLSACKPDPMPVLYILKEFSLSPQKTIIIGDGVPDIKAGKNAGILTCAVSYGMRDAQVLKKFEPDFMIDNFSQLQDFL
ncbi:MAG: HAD-IA family hydrolase [Candidatus Brocadiae bacterium]|nr:HAD-IA family hydrolase [Candidatus Brocadiia bacterium]